MKKRVVIVHQWGGSPETDWYAWLKNELEGRGYEVIVPAMPESNAPVIEKWVGALACAVGTLNGSDIFVGHSVGCQTILRYLESAQRKVAKVILVAPWLKLSSEVLDDPDYADLAGPWLERSIDWAKVKTRAQEFVAFFSEDDPYVPIENAELFKNNLGARIIIEDGMKHYDGENGITKVPQVLNAI